MNGVDDETDEESSDWYGHPRTLKLQRQVARFIDQTKEYVCAMVATGGASSFNDALVGSGELRAYREVEKWFNRQARSGK